MGRNNNNNNKKNKRQRLSKDTAIVTTEQNDNTNDAEQAVTQTEYKDAQVKVIVDNSATNDNDSTFISDGRYRNKQRCLVLASRGVTARFRHLLEDLKTLIPHHKKEAKLDADKVGQAVAEIAQIRNCNTILMLEARKRQDAYLWLSRLEGPSVRFLVTNIHTMDELRMTGNCMKGSRPILNFDASFDSLPQLQLVKQMFTDVFGTPRGHPKSKPFVDRIMTFYYADKRIWVRNYQIVQEQAATALQAQQEKKQHGKTENTSLVEIGPRFVLDIIRIFRGPMSGQTLYQNPDYVSPNTQRADKKRQASEMYNNRKQWHESRKERVESIVVPEDPLADVFR